MASIASRNETLDPVAAYDRIAPDYARISSERQPYLDAVERLVIARIPRGRRSLLDVGGGNGSRAARIAAAAGLNETVLLEPSARMRQGCPPDATVWAMRAEDLGSREGSFDVITCLWNVLGHVSPAASRVEVLRQFARLISPKGRIFIDVNHRYNARHYGALKTAARFLRDLGSRAGANGDVRVAWTVGGEPCATIGHVFTHREFAGLCQAAGLRIEARFVIDYASGERRRWSFAGNLTYILRRSPPEEPGRLQRSPHQSAG